jgi:SAM-dependent methyltransferase
MTLRHATHGPSVTSGFAPPAQRDHWTAISRRWEQVASPLRPCAEDAESYAEVVRRWADTHGIPRALILGVTPELYHLEWPAGSDLTAVDHTQAMIDAVWPGPRGAAVCADWRDMPLADGSRDIVLCDGGLSMLPYPQGHDRLIRTLRRVVAPNGLCVFRLYLPPVVRESPQAVLRDLLAGNVPNLNHLKLRLWTALQRDSRRGVSLAEVWNAVHRAAPDFDRLAAQIEWPREHLLAINTYQDCADRYYFPTVAELRGRFCEQPGGFVFHSLRFHNYPLGERCPLIVFRREA